MRRAQQLIVILGFLVLSAGTQHAMAATVASGPPATSQGGANTFIEPPSSESSQKLLFQQFGIGDYTNLTGANGSGGIGELNAPNDVGNIFATMWAGALYVIGFIATRLVEWAFSLNVVSALGGVIDQFTHSLQGSFYGPYLAVVLLIAAAICAYLLLVTTRFMRGVGGILWAGAAVALAAQLFISPSGMLDQVDGYATGVTQTFVVGVAQDTGATTRFYNQQDAANYEVQVLANQLWTDTVYDPWTMVEFGSVDPHVNGDQLGVELLKKNDGQSNHYDQDIQQAPKWLQDWANGNEGVPRMLFSGAVAFTGLLMLALTVLIALATIVAQLVVIIMGALTLPFWLLAPLPIFGMRLVMKWIAGIVAGFAVSTIGALYLILMLVLLRAVDSVAEGSVGLVVVGVLDIALVVVALWLRKTMFSIGKHTTRLPMALAGVSPGAAGHEVDAPHAVVRHSHAAMGHAGRSVVKPLYPNQHGALPAASSDGAAFGIAGATRKTAATTAKKAPSAAARKAGSAKVGAAAGGKAAAGTGVGTATAGIAVGAYAALRTGQAGLHAYEGLRRRTVSAVSGHLGHPISPGPQPLRHDGPSVAHAAWQLTQPHVHRVSKNGTKPLQGQRVRPLEAKKEPVHAGPPESVRTTRKKPKK